MMGSWLGVAGALIAVAGAIALLARGLQRMPRLGASNPEMPLAIVHRIAIGPRQGIALLRAFDRLMVVSIADSGTRLIAELDDPTLLARLQATPAPAAMLAQKLREAFSRGSRSGAAVLVAGVALTLTLAAAAPVLAQQTATSPTRAAALALAKQAAAAATPNAATAPAALAPRPINTTVPQPSTSAPTLRTGSPPVLSPGALHIVVPQPPQVQISIGDGANGVQLDGMVGLVVFLGALTLLPALFLLMTSFTRILIVLHFLRTALGTQTAPPTQLLVALSVLLTGVVMHPVLDQVNREAIQPYIAGQLPQADAYTRGFGPMREFMLSNTRTQDLETFAELTGVDSSLAVEELPVVTVVSAFVTSELRTAFQMGFVIFLPFVVVDLVVASVLMSLGMFMLPPMMISLPLKLLLFVLADGWVLVVQNLVQSFR